MTCEEATENPSDISIESRCRNSKGDTGDGSGRVVANPRKFLKFHRIGREMAVGAAEYGFGQFVEKACPTIVAEAFPMAEDGGPGCAGQRGPIREAFEPTIVIRKNRGDTGLLGHELRNCDVVWGGRGAPWKGALVFIKPSIKTGPYFADFGVDERAGGPRVRRHGGYDVYP
jgi:hypothetical protein